MESKFSVNTYGIASSDLYDYIHHIALDFLTKLSTLIAPFGYTLLLPGVSPARSTAPTIYMGRYIFHPDRSITFPNGVTEKLLYDIKVESDFSGASGVAGGFTVRTNGVIERYTFGNSIIYPDGSVKQEKDPDVSGTQYVKDTYVVFPDGSVFYPGFLPFSDEMDSTFHYGSDEPGHLTDTYFMLPSSSGRGVILFSSGERIQNYIYLPEECVINADNSVTFPDEHSFHPYSHHPHLTDEDGNIYFNGAYVVHPNGDVVHPDQASDPVDALRNGSFIAKYTSPAYAKKIKTYAIDFRIDRTDKSAKSRVFRIELPLRKSGTPIIGVVDEMKAKRNAWRDMPIIRTGSSKFLNSFAQKETRGNINLKWNKLDSLQTKKMWYFNVVVNEDMLLVFGGDSYTENASQIYGNYLSFIRTVSMEKPDRAMWISNGLTGVQAKNIVVDIPRPQSVEPPYARIGTLFKCGETKDLPMQWLCPRILVLPRVSSYARPIVNEDFTVLFSNDHNDRSENKVFYLYTISYLQAKPCIVLI